MFYTGAAGLCREGPKVNALAHVGIVTTMGRI